MKANNGLGNNELRDEWETPKWLFNILNDQYNFKLDCCATFENKKSDFYCDDFLDYNDKHCLIYDINKIIIISNVNCWMNPPFSKAKEMFKHFFKLISKGVAIYRCDNFETKLWQEIIFPNATWIFIPNKRIAYEGMEGKGSRFPSALIGFGVESPKFIEGTNLKVEK